jgi:pyruvate dehydrogenase E2 component (dihydrolipoamide acetyltransferase)
MFRFIATAPLRRGFAGVRWFSAAGALPPHTKITLPALSPTMTEGGLAKWKKKEGEAIKPGEVLCEIETDKATVDFEFQEEGVVARQLVKEGTTGLKVGTVIGIMVDDPGSVAAFAKAVLADFNAPEVPAATPPKPNVAVAEVEKKASVPSAPAQPAAQAPAQAKAPAPAPGPARPAGERVFASPYARRLAREQNKKLESIRGSGPNGRIVAADVMEAKAGQPAEAAAHSFAPGDVSWTLNKLLTPHYYLNVDVDLSEAQTACDLLNKSRKDKTPITVNEFILRAASLAMRKVPEANAAWGDGGSFRMYDYCDVNLSLMNSAGIVRAPLLKGIHTAGLEDIATRIKALQDKMNKGEDLEEAPGTFSVTNVGAFGVRSIVPIVRPGQTTALGIGALRKSLIPGETSPMTAKVATVATITLSCDHRVVDGAIGAEWLHGFKQLIEKPMSMLL